eukprot:COSAG03_NODE_705_length_6186_cov_3.663217_5_plen_73_part_00
MSGRSGGCDTPARARARARAHTHTHTPSAEHPKEHEEIVDVDETRVVEVGADEVPRLQPTMVEACARPSPMR